MLNHVEQEALDVGSIEILVSHDHNASVPQPPHAIVLLFLIQPYNLDDVLDLLIVDCLLEAGISDVEGLTAEREDSICVTSNNAQPCYSKCFRAVSLCQDEGALLRAFPSRPVGVFQLWDAKDSGGPSSGLHFLFHVDGLFGLGPLQHGVHNPRVKHLLHGCVRDLTFRPELGLLQSHRLLGLGVEGGIDDQAVDEDPQVVADVIRLDVHSTLVLRVRALVDGVHELVGNMHDVRATLRGVDGVHEGDLLELAIRG
mmetsp:Transcript_5509/g.13593  ORF Transcript_5509/g.13593 Transcript_5509/m.13593 type:complete len:256 (-) Transcript_5509:960-1727(-)